MYLSFFRKFVIELWPLIDVRLLFPLYILRKMDRVIPNFVYALILTRSRLGLLAGIFHKFVKELWPLIDFRFCFCSISLGWMDRI